MERLCVLMALVALMMVATDAQAFRVTTQDGVGADAELRESSDSNRGTNWELASRVDYALDELGMPTGYLRNSVGYMKFDVSTITAADLEGDIFVRTTYGQNSVFLSRFQDTLGGPNTGMQYFLMDNATPGANWGEETMTPSNAPAYNYDADMSTKPTYVDGYGGTPTAGLTELGIKRYDEADAVGANAHMPVGGAFDLVLGAGSMLHDAIAAAQLTDNPTVTIVFGVLHDWTIEAQNPNWVAFNYVMNGKEKTIVNTDADSPWGGVSESWFRNVMGGSFQPQLTNEAHPIPEPATMALLGLGGLLLRRKRN